MKRKYSKVLSSILIVLLLISPIPLNNVASGQDSIEFDEVDLLQYIESILQHDDEYEYEQYQEKKAEIINELLPEPEIGIQSTSSIQNESLSLAVGSNGRFTVGTTGGNPNLSTDVNKVLLYGHPRPGTSFTTIRINGEDYVFFASNSVVNESRNEIVSSQVISNVLVKQILSFEVNPTTNRADIVNIRYELTNNSEQNLSVGTRIMLDTMLGNNDGAPFRVPGIGEVLYERELVGAQIPQYWQAFDNLDNPNVVANGTLYRSHFEKPDKVQFVYWGDIFGTQWDYTVSPNKSVTRDSAIAIYHNPKAIAPGETRVINTYYGIGDFAISDLEAPLSVRITAPEMLAVDSTNGNYYSNPYTITAYVRNTGTEVTRNTTASLEIPPSSGLTILSPEDKNITLGNLGVGEEKIVTWTVLAASQPNDTTIDYSVKLNANNADEKEVPLSLYLPQVTSNSDGTIDLNVETLHLNAGESETLRAILNGYRGSVTWLSDNPNVATVDSNGRVTAKSGGTAKIIAAVGGKVAICTVTVSGNALELEGITFTTNRLELSVNETKRLNVQFTPSNATNRRIKTWVSNDPNVATVSNGIVRGVSTGTTTIMAISEVGEHVASTQVTVTEAEPRLNFGEGLNFSQNIDGPTVSFGGYEFPLFSIPIGMDVKIADVVQLTYDPHEDKFIGYFGDLSDPRGTDDVDSNGRLTEHAKQLRKDTYQDVKALMNKLGRSTNRDFYNSYRSTSVALINFNY